MSGQIDEAEVARIAAGLAQREALISFPEGWSAGPELDDAIINELASWRKDGLVERQFGDMFVPATTCDGETITTHLSACWWFRLTPLGLAVRKHLEAQR